jgi:S1-C subfamily serine protease
MKPRTDPFKLLRPWLRAAWRSLLLLVLGGLLGAAVAGGLSAQSGKAGSTASMADAAGSQASKPTSASSVTMPTIDKLREQLTKGDVIVTVANTDITSFDDLLTVLATKKPGDTVTVTAVDPNGHKHTYTVKLNELDVYASS